jgi:hypothetical protein
MWLCGGAAGNPAAQKMCVQFALFFEKKKAQTLEARGGSHRDRKAQGQEDGCRGGLHRDVAPDDRR